MAHRLGHQLSRDRRAIEREEAEFLAEADRIRERNQRQERERLRERERERLREREHERERERESERERERDRERERERERRWIEEGSSSSSRSSFERRRAAIDLYEPRRRTEIDRYARLPEVESASQREIRLRDEADAYLNERIIAREIERRAAAQIPIPRRREPRPLLNLTTGEALLYERGRERIIEPIGRIIEPIGRIIEPIGRIREPLYQHVVNPRYREERRLSPYEDLVYEEEVGYDERLVDEVAILRDADEYARIRRMQREEELYGDGRRW